MSITTYVAPDPLNTPILPSLPTCTTTRLATVCPPTKFRSDALGLPVPLGQTVRTLGAVGPVTVTLITTAFGGVDDPIAGTPPPPATVTTMVAPDPTRPPMPPVPLRVSTMRVGETPTNTLPLAVAS